MSTILVVEDNAFNLELVLQILEESGHDTLDARDGAEGVEVALREVPDLILMDLSMPRMDGSEATKLLRADPRTKHIPIVVLSAHAMPGEDERARAIGANGFLAKPLDEDELLEVIADLLEAP